MNISLLRRYELCRKTDLIDASEDRRHVTLEKNGKTHDFIPEEVSSDRINAIQVSLDYICT